MATKLTEKHINLPPFAALRVKLATQILLSHSAAAGISTMVALHALPVEAKDTAVFIDRFDKLFNAMKSYTIKSSRPCQNAITNISQHRNFLQKALCWLRTISGNSKIKICHALRAAKLLSQQPYSYLMTSALHKINFLLTSRLNQDCVKNMFSVIRGKGDHRDNPDIKQFT